VVDTMMVPTTALMLVTVTVITAPMMVLVPTSTPTFIPPQVQNNSELGGGAGVSQGVMTEDATRDRRRGRNRPPPCEGILTEKLPRVLIPIDDVTLCAARRWVIRRLAERAVQIVREEEGISRG
jgi:hypothetical protein